MGQESKQEKVIAAAIELFSQQGYHDTVVSEIADKAGVAKGTVYWYFDSKEKLFWEIIVSGIESINQQLEELLNQNQLTAFEKLEEVINLYLNFFKTGKEIAKMMQECSVKPGQYFHDEMDKLRTEAVNNLAEIIQEGQSEGQFIEDVDSQEVANFILGALAGSYNPHVYQLENVEEKVDLVLNIIVNGISA
ncbi:MAG: TetR/AcrR family transcriptional regulator [Bacillota bacterium]